ncbi:MAG: HD domain-containing protein [Bryobacteraceae bacterium]|nr:HD domain-containing protein [Bryobacteraceae bacterium]MDW8378335.1 HD domain-containing protein [Bryobacterales bacterium]
MKSPYVSELQPSQVVTAVFLVQHKDIRQKKTGEPYLSLVLGDRTGEVEAKMWDNAEEVMDTFDRDDFVRVRGLVQIHQNRQQLMIQKLQRVDESTVELADFFPTTRRDVGEMMAELRSFVESFRNPDLRALCLAFLNDPDVDSRLRVAPAAKSMHHAYLGGLLEHICSMAKLAQWLGPHYGVDEDLLLTGVLLHDMGKIYELSYERSFGYTAEGHLLGHLAIALRMLDEKIRSLPSFPAKLRVLIEHMILSHHGQLEFGSPKLPAFAEAVLLHHIDNLDSKMDALRGALEKDRNVEGFLTGFSPALERQIFRKDRYLQPESKIEETGVSLPPAPEARPLGHTGAGSVNYRMTPDNPVTAGPRPAAPEGPVKLAGSRPGGFKPAPISAFAEQLQKALRDKDSQSKG